MYAQRTPVTLRLPDSIGGTAVFLCAAVNPVTGHFYVGGRYGNAVIVVDGDAGTRVASIPVESWPSAICINPTDNKVYVADGLADRLLVVDGATDRVLSELQVPARPQTLCYSPGSDKVYCVGDDSMAVIDGRGDVIIRRMPFPRRWDKHCYDSRRDRIWWGQTGSYDPYLVVLDCATDSVTDSVDVEFITHDICYEPLTDRVYSAQNTKLYVIDAASDSITAVLSSFRGGNVASDGARDLLYAAQSSDETLYVLDGTTLDPVDTVALPRMVRDVCYLPNEDKVLCGGRAGVCLVDAAPHRLIADLRVGGSYSTVLPDSSRGRVYCYATASDDIAVIDGTGDSTLFVVPAGLRPATMCWDPGRELLYVAGDSSSVISVVDPARTRVIATVVVGMGPTALCYVPTTDRVYTANGGYVASPDSTVSIIDCSTNTEAKRIHAGADPIALCHVPAHDEVWCASTWGPMSVIDVATESVTCWIPADANVRELCYNPVHDKVYWFNSWSPAFVGVMDAATHSRLGYVLRDADPTDLAYSEVLDKLYALHVEGLAVISGCTDSVLARPDLPDGVRWTQVVCTPEGDRVYCLDEGEPFGGRPGHLATLDAAVDTVIGVIELPPSRFFELAYDDVTGRVYSTDFYGERVFEFDHDGTAVTDTIPVGFNPWAILSPARYGGIFTANCSGQSVTWVKPPDGIESDNSPPDRPARPVASIARTGAAVLPAGSMLLDASGRIVRRTGVDSGTHLPTGVYFVRLPGGWLEKLLVVR